MASLFGLSLDQARAAMTHAGAAVMEHARRRAVGHLGVSVSMLAQQGGANGGVESMDIDCGGKAAAGGAGQGQGHGTKTAVLAKRKLPG